MKRCVNFSHVNCTSQWLSSPLIFVKSLWYICKNIRSINIEDKCSFYLRQNVHFHRNLKWQLTVSWIIKVHTVTLLFILEILLFLLIWQNAISRVTQWKYRNWPWPSTFWPHFLTRQGIYNVWLNYRCSPYMLHKLMYIQNVYTKQISHLWS